MEVHFLPAHRFLSDAFTGNGSTAALSWFAASFEVVAAVVVAAVAFLERRRRGAG